MTLDDFPDHVFKTKEDVAHELKMGLAGAIDALRESGASDEDLVKACELVESAHRAIVGLADLVDKYDE